MKITRENFLSIPLVIEQSAFGRVQSAENQLKKGHGFGLKAMA
jgi:hypothetical protein